MNKGLQILISRMSVSLLILLVEVNKGMNLLLHTIGFLTNPCTFSFSVISWSTTWNRLVSQHQQ
jgi:hypothetical protein